VLLHNGLDIAGDEVSPFRMIKRKWGVWCNFLDGFTSNNKAVCAILYIS